MVRDPESSARDAAFLTWRKHNSIGRAPPVSHTCCRFAVPACQVIHWYVSSLKAIQHHVLLLQLTIATLHVNKAALQDAKKKVELTCGLHLGPDIHAEPSIIALSQTIHRYHPESRCCFVSLPASRLSDCCRL